MLIFTVLQAVSKVSIMLTGDAKNETNAHKRASHDMARGGKCNKWVIYDDEF